MPLQRSFRYAFVAARTLPYHVQKLALMDIRDCGDMLSPVSFSAQVR